jgi:hypothetical protein
MTIPIILVILFWVLLLGGLLALLVATKNTHRNLSPQTTAQPTVPDSDDDASSTTGPSSTGGETTAISGSGRNWWLIALLILGVIGGGIWWVSTLPTSSSYTVSGLVYEDNSKKFVTFDIPKKWQQNSCFSIDTIINAKVVTIAGVDEVIKISPTNGRCWSGEKKVRHVTFRLADKSVSRVSVTFEKK